MTIPVDIVAAFGAVVLTVVIASWASFSKRINRVEKTVLTIVIMLSDRGFRIPDASDTDRLLRKSRREGI